MPYQGGEAELKRRVRWRETLPEPPMMRAVWVMVDVCCGSFCVEGELEGKLRMLC